MRTIAAVLAVVGVLAAVSAAHSATGFSPPNRPADRVYPERVAPFTTADAVCFFWFDGTFTGAGRTVTVCIWAKPKPKPRGPKA